MKIFAWFKTNRALRVRIGVLEAELQMMHINAVFNREAATRVLNHQRAELRRMAHKIEEANIRKNQLHNAAENLAKFMLPGPAAMRAKAHWESIR